MTATSHPEFSDRTEGLEVAKVFSGRIHGKTIVVTGVNRAGLGFALSEAFASQSPACLVIAGRTPAKIQESIDALKEQYPNVDYRSLHIDLSSQKSIHNAAAELLSWFDVPIIDIIVNSAGITHIPKRTFNSDGIEMTFATNHVGHFLFTCLVMPKLIKAAEGNLNNDASGAHRGATRVVNVSSGSPTVAKMRWSDMRFDKKSKDLPEAERPNYNLHTAWGVIDPENESYIALEAYNQSKVANVLFGIGISERLYNKYGILGLAVHPGVIETELGRNATLEVTSAMDSLLEKGYYSYRTLGAGVSTALVAALDPKLGKGKTKDGKENHGAFLIDCQISDRAQPLAVSSSEAEKLWALSEELVHERFAW